jgi:hypothetical protein
LLSLLAFVIASFLSVIPLLQFVFIVLGVCFSIVTIWRLVIEIDEELQWADTSSDTNRFRVERRWIPIEAPEDNYDTTPATYTRYLDSNPYQDQAFLRSTMVQDNMYLTNQSDEVQKFDGSNIFWKVILKHLTPETIAFIKKDYEVTIQTLLTTHTAHLVERLESLRPTEVQKVMGDLNGTEAKYQLFDHALDQAIDIIKDNK